MGPESRFRHDHPAAARRLPFVRISKWLCRRLHSEPMEPSVKTFRDSDKREPPNSRGMVVPEPRTRTRTRTRTIQEKSWQSCLLVQGAPGAGPARGHTRKKLAVLFIGTGGDCPLASVGNSAGNSEKQAFPVWCQVLSEKGTV